MSRPSLVPLSFEEVAARCEGSRDVLIISAVNYEHRSLGFLKRWCEKKTPLMHTKALLVVVGARKGRVEPLEAIKASNWEIAQHIVRSAKVASSRFEIVYPDNYEPLALESEFREVLHGYEAVPTIVVDVSALPTRVLVPLINVLAGYKKVEPHSGVFIAYTSAGAYPRSTSVTQVGSVRLVCSGLGLDKFVPGRAGKCIVVLGRQGSDTHQVLGSLPAGFDVELMHMVHKDDIDHSLHVLAANRSALDYPNASLRYFSTMASGSRLLSELSGAESGRGGDVTLIANFGPKPLTVAALWCVRKLQPDPHARVRSDLLTLSAHYYGSVYSVGTGDTALYEL